MWKPSLTLLSNIPMVLSGGYNHAQVRASTHDIVGPESKLYMLSSVKSICQSVIS